MTQFKTKQIKKSSKISKNLSSKKKIKKLKSAPKNPKKTLRKIVAVFLVLSVCVFGGILVLQAIGKVHISKDNEYKIFSPITISIDDEEEAVVGPKGIKNILIAGIGGSGHAGGDLTDSLMLASINFDAKSVTLLSIPRDLYVAYSRTTAGRINALYHIGKSEGQGVNLLAEKIHEITGQGIDHYAIVDFQGFKKIVDTLGGITVDVPKTIHDTAYPTYNWTYTTFHLDKGRQTLNGETALRYARSRHSTSDFDRSARQQLILRAIKEKAVTLGILVQPQKIAEIFDSLQTHINTDLTIGNVTDMALAFRDIKKEDIHLYNLNSNCAYMKCSVGAYLYNPHPSYFGGAAAIIPEKAAPSRLSTYDDIINFSKIIFEFPTLTDEPKWIEIHTTKWKKWTASLVRKWLEQLGFQIEHKEAIVYSDTLADTSSIQVYTGANASGATLSEESISVQALKKLEPTLPIEFLPAATGTGVKIEIVLGADVQKYFDFAKPVNYYLNDISPKEETTTSGSAQATTEETPASPQDTPDTTNVNTSSQEANTETPKPADEAPVTPPSSTSGEAQAARASLINS